MSIARHDNARCPARTARVPIHPAAPAEIRDRETAPLKLIGVGHEPTHIVVLTADGARGYGMLDRHSTQALDALDALLDYRDAANEDADGLLPHQRVGWTAPPARIVALPRHRRARWTRETIIKALQAWHSAEGRVPAHNDWIIASKYRPAAQTVLYHFNTWNEAIRAAGMQPRSAPHSRKRAA